MRVRWNLFVVPALVLLASSPAGAAVTNYYGLDAGAGPASPRPNSNAQAAAFDTAAGALGSLSLITCETLPAYSTNIPLGGGVTAMLAGAWTQSSTGILSAPGAAGGMMFFGFTDPGAQITSVTIEEAGAFGFIDDSFSLDDIRYVAAGGAAPQEAAAIPALSGWGLAAMAVRRTGVWV